LMLMTVIVTSTVSTSSATPSAATVASEWSQPHDFDTTVILLAELLVFSDAGHSSEKWLRYAFYLSLVC
jgi:hypothetical protein